MSMEVLSTWLVIEAESWYALIFLHWAFLLPVSALVSLPKVAGFTEKGPKGIIAQAL